MAVLYLYVRAIPIRESVARTAVPCAERLLARVQLGEPRLGGLCLGRRAPASGHRPVRSPREWRRQAGAARAAGADVSTHTAGECGGVRIVLTQRPCATARAGAQELVAHGHELRLRSSAFSRSSGVHGPTGRHAGSAWPRLRALSMIARRCGSGVPSPSTPTRRPLKFGHWGQATELSADPDSHLRRRFAASAATNILRRTSTHNQTIVHAAPMVLSGRAGELSHSTYSHSTRSSHFRAP